MSNKKWQWFQWGIIVVLIFTIVVSPPYYSPANDLDIDQATNNVQEEPVIFNDQTIFFLRSESGSFSPQERAEIISKRIEAIAQNSSIKIDDFGVDTLEDNLRVFAGKKTIVTITDADAEASDLPPQELANEHLESVKKAVERYRRERKPFYWIIGIILTVFTTLLLILILKFFNKIFPWIDKLVDSWQETLIPNLRIQNLVLLSSQQLTELLKTAIKIGRLALTLLILYLFIPLVLNFFPQTRRLGRTLFGYLLAAVNIVWEAFVSYLPNLFILAVIIFTTYYSLRFLKFVFLEIERGTLSFPGFYPEWSQPTYRLLTWFIIALAAVFTFPYLPGFNSPAFQGVSAFVALLFTLGSTGVISNTVSGFVLIYTRAFQVGDRVQIGDSTGDVLEKNLLATRLLTIKNVVITIPNSAILNSNVINYTAMARDLDRPLILHTTITLGYDVSWRKVHQVLIDAAKATEYILEQPPPFVLQTSLNDFYVSYELNACTRESSKMAAIYSQLHQNIQDKCNEADIEILSPHYSALRDGNQTTIPEAYLPRDYTPPGFRVFRQEQR